MGFGQVLDIGGLESGGWVRPAPSGLTLSRHFSVGVKG